MTAKQKPTALRTLIYANMYVVTAGSYTYVYILKCMLSCICDG